MSGRFISTHSVALVLPMHIAYVPERGGSVHADAASSRPGGGFTTLCAAAAMGVPTAAASPLGTGPNSPGSEVVVPNNLPAPLMSYGFAFLMPRYEEAMKIYHDLPRDLHVTNP